jgi:hypothetical protein
MKRLAIPMTVAFCLIVNSLFAQRVPGDKVPQAVKAALTTKCPDAKGVAWEKEKGNFEAGKITWPLFKNPFFKKYLRNSIVTYIFE